MTTAIRWAIPALVLVTGLALTTRQAAANPDFTKRERKACVYCHVGSWDSGKLTDAATYFHTHGTLRGFVQKPYSTQSKEQPAKEAPKQETKQILR